MLAGRQGRVEAKGPDGVERVWAFVPIERTNAHLAVGLPKAELVARARADLERGLLLVGALALLAIAGAWLGGELFVMRSVRALAEAARRIGAGELNARARLPRSAGELRLVADAVNDMAERVARREGEVKEKSALLEATLGNMDQRACW